MNKPIKTVIAFLICFIISPLTAIASDRISANHSSAQTTLKRIYQAQQEFKKADPDKNGKHDHGTIEQLYQAKLIPYDLTFDIKSGYHRSIYLPQNTESTGEHWCAFAWPDKYELDGFLTYFVSEKGEVLETNEPLFTGQNGPPLSSGFIGEPFISPINIKKWLPEDTADWSRYGKMDLYVNIYFFSLLIIMLIAAELISRFKQKKLQEGKGITRRNIFLRYISRYKSNIAALVCFIIWSINVLTAFICIGPPPSFFYSTLSVLGIFFSFLNYDEGRILLRIINGLIITFFNFFLAAIIVASGLWIIAFGYSVFS